MKGSSKVIMGATMAIVILLAIVLGLVLVLLAELYCSLLFRRRKLGKASKPGSLPERPETPQAQQVQDQGVPSPLGSFYAQGVLEAPRSFLFPKLPSRREQHRESAEKYDIEKPKHGKLCQFLKIPSPHQMGLGSLSSSPSPSYISLTKPHQTNNPPKPEIEHEDEGKQAHDNPCEEARSGGGKGEGLMYISNPIYDNEVGQAVTPFETPDSSPSRLGQAGASGDEGREKATLSSPSSLPLSPMKELPAKACSVALKDARCLNTSGSECNSNIGRSSSSSGSPYTSPSW